MRTPPPRVPDRDTGTVQQPTLLLVPGLVVVALILGTNLSLPQYLPADLQRVLELVLLLLAVVIGLAVPAVRRATVGLVDGAPRVVGAALGFVALGVASSAVALLPGDALLEVAMHVLLAWLVAVVAAAVARAPREVSTVLLLGLAGVILLYSLRYLLLPDLLPRGQGLWQSEWLGGFSNPRYLGQLYALTLPLAAALSLAPGLARGMRIIFGLVAASAWWAMVLMAERGAPIALVAAGVVTAFVLHRRERGFRRLGVRHLALGAAGLVAGFATRVLLVLAQGGGLTLGAVLDRDVTSSSGRVALWEHAIELAADHPLLGIGPGHYAHVDYLLTPTSPTSPHNLPLKIAAEWGLPAIMVLVALAVLGLIAMRRHQPPVVELPELGIDDGLVTAAVTTSVAAALALSLVSGVGATAVGQLLLATALGWLVGLHADGLAQDREPSSALRWPSALAVAVVLLASVPVATTLVTTSPDDLYASIDGAVTTGGRTGLQPRFWTQGIIGLDTTTPSPGGDG